MQVQTDINECSLQCLNGDQIPYHNRGQIICNLGDSLGSELNNCLPIFLERLKNEITRLTTVKALSLIAASPLKINLRPILVSTHLFYLEWGHSEMLLSGQAPKWVPTF